MLSLLLKLKSLLPCCALLAAILGASYGWYWHHQYSNAQATVAQQLRENATCKANQDLLESAVQRWKAAAAQYDKQLKRKEALVAKQYAESQKRIQTIIQTSYSPDCNTAVQQGVQQAHKLGFSWNNNIP